MPSYTEEQYASGLSIARTRKELVEVQSEADRVVKPPSGVLYFFLYGFSIIGDIIDLADFTGVGAAVSFVVDIFIGIILFFAGRAARNRIETMNKFQDEIHGHIQNIERRVVSLRNNYVRAIKISRKIKPLRKPVRKLVLRVSKLRKSIARNPMTRTMIAVVADLIPFLGIIPWRTINIYLMKRDEMRAFQEAQEMLPEYEAAREEEMAEANQLSEAQSH
ncbi:MAG: hypothetical protein WD898_03635 [Candidatus Paceibacterota bacterium]